MDDENQESINLWAIKTFGPRKHRFTAPLRMNLEVAELLDKLSKADIQGVADECADVYIVLCQVAASINIDLHDKVNEKMEINRNRKWKLHGDGTAQHIE